MRLLPCVVVFLLLLVAAGAAAANLESQPRLPRCRTSQDMAHGNAVRRFFNRCLVPHEHGKAQFIAVLAQRISLWLSAEQWLHYCVALLIVLPCVAQQLPPSSARARVIESFRVQTLALIMRIGVGISAASWLQVAINQPTPCECQVECQGYIFTSEYLPFPQGVLGSSGLPSLQLLVGTIVCLHLAERVSWLLGLLLLGAQSSAELLSGASSLGQLLAGVAFGALLHVFGTRTPLLLRAVDAFLSLACGLLTLGLAKAARDAYSVLLGLGFVDGTIIQVFAFVAFFATVDYTAFAAALPRALYAQSALATRSPSSGSSAALLRSAADGESGGGAGSEAATLQYHSIQGDKSALAPSAASRSGDYVPSRIERALFGPLLLPENLRLALAIGALWLARWGLAVGASALQS